MTRTCYRFTGTITAETGLTVTRPDEKFPSPAGSNLKLSKDAQRLPRLGALREDSQAYFPATSLRGALRRAARSVVRRAVVSASGEAAPWSVDTHYMLTQGVDTTNKVLSEKSAGTIGNEEDLRTENPMLSLFGRWKLPGHLAIDNAVPFDRDCLYVEGRGARSNDFLRDPSQANFLTPEEAVRLTRMIEQDGLASIELADIDAQIKKLRAEIRTIQDSDEKAEVNEQIKTLDDQKKAVKAAKDGSREAIQRPLEGFEAIIPGTEMKHRMMIGQADHVELGLFLAALREFARAPYVGGHRALHCGEISGKWACKVWPVDGEPQNVGEVSFSSEGFFVTKGSVLEKALSKWDESVQDQELPYNFERFLLVE